MSEALLVDHDGRLYPAAALFEQVPALKLRELEGVNARSWQDLWDATCRLWPLLAASIAAGVTSIPQKRV